MKQSHLLVGEIVRPQGIRGEVKLRHFTDDPYRFEKRIGGQRTYMGCPIPDEAPPRPEDNAIWNDRTKQWILPRLRSKAAS